MTTLPGPNVLLRSGVGALRYRLTGHRMPLAVQILLTHRCDAFCRTCSVPLQHRAELDTRAWITILDDLARLGTVRVTFSGGEPLVREDLPALVERCTAHGISTTLDTNGYRYPARADSLLGLGRVMIGLEGREEAHDAIREPGAFRRAQDAIAAARSRGIEVWTVTTLTRLNLDDIDWILDEAERTGAKAAFQLLQPDSPQVPRSAAGLIPAPEDARRALRTLLEARLSGRPVGVSEKLLRYLLTWEDYDHSTTRAPHEDVHCVAGQLHCTIEADGSVFPCSLLAGRYPARSAATAGFARAFEALRDNECRACTSTPLTEYNFLYNLNAAALYERLRSSASPTRSNSSASSTRSKGAA